MLLQKIGGKILRRDERLFIQIIAGTSKRKRKEKKRNYDRKWNSIFSFMSFRLICDIFICNLRIDICISSNFFFYQKLSFVIVIKLRYLQISKLSSTKKNTKLHFTRKFLEFEQIIPLQSYNNIYFFSLVENNGVFLTWISSAIAFRKYQ